MRKNQKGFTLVELIIAVAIMAIVTLAVCGFIVVGSRSYTSANTDIMLQQEAQLALNQISDVIIDTTDSINYGNGTETVLKDSEFSSEPDQKILVVVNKKDGNNDNDSYRFEWSKTDETIYFNTSDDANPDPDFDDTKRAILAQHVKEFHIDISQFEENRVVMISMTFENGNKEYTTSNNVTVRNRIALNKIDVAPMKKAQEFTITTVKSVTLEPGDIYDLGDIAITQVDTTASDAEDKKIIWELVDNSATTSDISTDGMLSIGSNETRKSFEVRVRRAKEEYANQNNKVAQTVKVNIKRVTSVDLTCTEATIKAGNLVTVNGSAVGNLLGNSCEAALCVTDDESKDHDLSGWRIVRGSAVIESAGTREATLKILSTAKVGDEIEIEATSDLSARKDYDDVKGTLILKVTEGTMGDLPLQKGFKFGTSDDPGPLVYMRDPYLKTDYWQYVMCVRVREQNSTDASNDQVVMYLTGGADVRFFPDLFGLELNRDYNVFFQVLDPISKENRKNQYGGYTEDPADVIVKEYLDNLDPITGKYVGDKYEAGPQFGGILSQPKIEVGYNGIKYPNDNKDYYETYSFYTSNGRAHETVMDRPWLGDVENITREGVLNDIKFTVYKGEGNDPAGWERIYGFNPETLQYDSGSSALPGGAVYVDVESNRNNVSSQFLKWNQNNLNIREACGTYHIVPGYVYANNRYVKNFNYIYESDNITRDYAKHYYEQPQCTITIKISLGRNMELISANGEKQWAIFPLPADEDFPFHSGTTEVQTTKWNLAIYAKEGQHVKDLNVTVEGSYIPAGAGSKDAYKIELYSTETRGKITTKTVYGTYKCSVGGDYWDIVNAGTVVEESSWRATIVFNRWGDKKIEVPLPSEADFPNVSDGQEYRDVCTVTFYEANDKYGDGSNKQQGQMALVYSYNGVSNTYTLRLEEAYQGGPILGTWTCTSTGTEWKKVN